jgi:hypothetical protein
MPKTPIKQLYRSTLEDIAMYFYVEGQRDIVPSVPVLQAIKNFAKKCEILDDDFDVNQANVIYYRLKKRYFDACKTDSGDSK